MPVAKPKGRRVPKRLVKVGMPVTCKKAEPAYYTGRNGVPEVLFEPGMVGVVGAVDCPAVTYGYRRRGGTATFVCVDFEVDGQRYRCALDYNNIKILRKPS